MNEKITTPGGAEVSVTTHATAHIGFGTRIESRGLPGSGIGLIEFKTRETLNGDTEAFARVIGSIADGTYRTHRVSVEVQSIASPKDTREKRTKIVSYEELLGFMACEEARDRQELEQEGEPF